ncbi:spindle and kinetochore-associated protein 1-like [Anopheles nili]|uniref:spindle and kinetochore-associated protein 1-like n=1 Tax=Anopheles nili TaxID=185578 RepID=UPI00237B70B8|nr:spindle and kinetochore-associated protein 1-like [Anopheles nili]
MSITLENLFHKQLETVSRIELFLNIYKCKEFVLSDLKEMQTDVHEAAEKLQRTKEYLETDRKYMSSQFIEIMRKMRRNEMLMLHLLEVGPHAQQPSTTNPAQQSSMVKQIPLKEIQNPSESTSKMHLSDYSKSPFTLRSKVKCMNFFDFDAIITEEQFETIPKYLKGRMQLVELNQFLEKEVIKCFEEKYTLMYKQRKVISNQHDLAVWKEYNHLQANFPEHNFITQEDLSRKMGKMLDKKSYTKIHMLRHLHILQEVRIEGTVYFLWIYNK